ncbi:hypothetical protein PV328_003573 [Microctonus aethiopoides]|uniref:Uncharacterized protein n=1 Tax=Microctonus aethiopoides TaxID=144406 RepID=A0AA39F8Q1_9HYME|nr:hypothetical protein PV328_003573 [Microctonus aethiopoides]
MGHDRGDCMSIIHSSEDEEGYSRSNFFMKNHPGIFGETIALREIVFDDTDQQFWAEDELSSSDSRPIVFKHKRRHSVAHRNRTYRSRSRLNHTSSSSSCLSNAKTPPVRRRRKRQDKYTIIISKRTNNGTRRSRSKKKYITLSFITKHGNDSILNNILRVFPVKLAKTIDSSNVHGVILDGTSIYNLAFRLSS